MWGWNKNWAVARFSFIPFMGGMRIGRSLDFLTLCGGKVRIGRSPDSLTLCLRLKWKLDSHFIFFIPFGWVRIGWLLDSLSLCLGWSVYWAVIWLYLHHSVFFVMKIKQLHDFGSLSMLRWGNRVAIWFLILVCNGTWKSCGCLIPSLYPWHNGRVGWSFDSWSLSLVRWENWAIVWLLVHVHVGVWKVNRCLIIFVFSCGDERINWAHNSWSLLRARSENWVAAWLYYHCRGRRWELGSHLIVHPF
jgi:hypothetical protein